jgi:hypothetical protein
MKGEKMKIYKRLSFLLSALMISSNLLASPAKGQEVLERVLKSGCSLSLSDIAAKHTQQEWEELKESGKLKSELMKFSKKMEKIKEDEISDVFDFLYEYAKDSGLLPSCG